MPASDKADLHWGLRALDYARAIASLATEKVDQEAASEPLPGRGSATRAERKAAEIVCQQLQRLGVIQLEIQPFQGLRSLWLFLAQVFGFALAGHAAFWLLSDRTGVWPAWIVSLGFFAFSAILLWRKFTFQSTPLHSSLPHGPSQNVLAKLPPLGETQQRIVMLGHLDSHRAVIWYANDLLLKVYAAVTPLAVFGVFVAPLLYLFANLSAWRFFAYGGVGLGALHFLAWMTGMIADLGPYSPGANDNASAVGTLLTLAEHLQTQPLQHTEVWLAFTGCEETGCGGLLALLHEHGDRFRDAVWLDFELVGIGSRLVYLKREGVLRKKRISARMETILIKAAEKGDLHLQAVDAGWLGVFTEAGALWEHGYQAACLVSMRQEKAGLPEWHRLTDTSDRLEAAALERTHCLAWNILQLLDGQA